MGRFSAKLTEHFHAPRNAGALEDADVIGRGSLDDRAPYTTLYLKITNQTVARCGFQTFGCGVSIACASVLTELLIGQTIDAGRAITAESVIEALDGIPDDKRFCAEVVVSALCDALKEWALQEEQVEINARESCDGNYEIQGDS